MSSLDITIYFRPFCVEGWLHVCSASDFFSLEAGCHASAAGLRVDPNRLLKLVAAVDFDAECSEEFVVLLLSCCRPASAQSARHRSALPQGNRNPMNCPSLGYYLCLGYHPLPQHRGRRKTPPSHSEHHHLCDSTLWSECCLLGVKLIIFVC